MKEFIEKAMKFLLTEDGEEYAPVVVIVTFIVILAAITLLTWTLGFFGFLSSVIALGISILYAIPIISKAIKDYESTVH